MKRTISLQQQEIQALKAVTSKIDLNFELRFNVLLSKLFTPTQINMILYPKLKVYKWTPDDISSAITLRSISPKAYRYLRDQKHFPLPGRIKTYFIY